MDNSHIQNFLSPKTKKILLKQVKFQNIILIFEKILNCKIDPKNVEVKHTYVLLKKMSVLQKVFIKQNNQKIIPLLQKEIDTIQSIKFY